MNDAKSLDYGCDPLEGGMFKMIPSGDIVNYEERIKRLPIQTKELPAGVLGLSWKQIEYMQGGKLKIK